MGNAIFLYDDYGYNATLSGGTYQAALPLANAKTSDLHQVARTTNATNAATLFNANLGRNVQVDGVVIGPTNVSRGATWRVRSFTNSGMGTVKYDSGTLTVPGTPPVDSLSLDWENPGFWFGISDTSEIDPLPDYLSHVIPTASAANALAQYWKVEFFDASNAYGYIQFGRQLFAKAWRPSFNYSYGASMGIEPIVTVAESLAGNRRIHQRGLRRTWRCTFDNLPETELFGTVARMGLVNSVDRQMFVIPDTADVTFGNRRSFLGTYRSIPSIEQALFQRGSVGFDIEEVL